VTQQQPKYPISICMIVKNEEKRLKDALESVTWAEEIIILDDVSTDRTVESAKDYTDKIFTREMDVAGRQRNFCYEKASQKWIFSLDADERMTPPLMRSIQSVVHSDTNHNGFDVAIKTFIGDKWVKGAGYYPAHKLRMFRKGKFKYEESSVHPRAHLEGTTGLLAGDILHYSCENFTQFISKFNHQTELEAKKWIQDGRKVSFLNILRKTIDRFIKYYFLKGGMQDGFLGFFVSTFHSLYQFHSYAKYWEMKSLPQPNVLSRSDEKKDANLKLNNA